jgi:rhodanese-related sulfurtransferase
MFPFRFPIPTIPVDEAAARARTGRLVLVDVREPREVAQAAIPGARHIPVGQLTGRSGELPRDRQIGFVCRSGRRSAAATRAALQTGVDAVNVEGGVMAWSRAGLPLDSKREDVA